MSTIFRDSAKLLSANVIAQAIGLLAYPILTRLYSPDDFGLLYIFTSIAGVLVLLGTAGYQFAVPLPKDEKDGAACFHVGLVCLAGILLLLILSLPFANSIVGLFDAPQLAKWYCFLPLYVALLCLWNLMNGWYTRCRQFGSIGSYQVSNSLVSVTLKLLLGWKGISSGLMIGAVATPPVSVGISAVSARKHLRDLFFWDSDKCKRMFTVYKNFPLFTLPQSLINQFFGNLPAYLLAPQFGQSALGLWSMALILSFTPVNTICNSIYQVLLANVSGCVNNNESVRHIFVRFERLVLVTIIPLFTVLFFILPSFTGWLLGAEWIEVGHYIRWFLPWLCVTLLCSSTAFVPDVFFKQRITLEFEILLAVLRTCGIVAGMWTGTFMIAVAGYGIGSAVAKLAQYIWMRKLVNDYERSLT